MVVIAIIGILAAIVTPRVSRAMDSAKAQKCRNNLKQLHAAVLSYIADHNGNTPAAQSHELYNSTAGTYSQSNSRGWVAWVPSGRSEAGLEMPWEKDNTKSHAGSFRDDLGIGSDAKFAVENGELFDYVGDLQFYVCPLIRAKVAPAIEFEESSDGAKDQNGSNIYRTYAMNAFFRCSQRTAWERLSSKIGTSYTYGGHIPEPSKLLLFTEVEPASGTSETRGSRLAEARDGKWIHDGCINPKKWNSKGDDVEQIYAVHPNADRSKGNIALAVFFDGHIESVYPFQDGKGNTAWFLNRGWTPGTEAPVDTTD